MSEKKKARDARVRAEALRAIADEVDHGIMHPEVTYLQECPVCAAVRLIRARAKEAGGATL